MIVSKTHSSTPSSPGVSEPFVDDILQGDPIGTMGHQGQRGERRSEPTGSIYMSVDSARHHEGSGDVSMEAFTTRTVVGSSQDATAVFHVCSVHRVRTTLLRDEVENMSLAHGVGETQRRICTRTITVRLWHAMNPIFHPYG